MSAAFQVLRHGSDGLGRFLNEACDFTLMKRLKGRWNHPDLHSHGLVGAFPYSETTVASPGLLVKIPQGPSFQGDCGKIPLVGEMNQLILPFQSSL